MNPKNLLLPGFFGLLLAPSPAYGQARAPLPAVTDYVEHNHGSNCDLLSATESMNFLGSRIHRDES